MKLIVSLLSIAFGLLIAWPVFSEDKAAVQAPATAVSKAVEVGNKICPVSGEKVEGDKGDMGGPVKIEHNGKIYNLCCPMCIKDFKKDPQKYIEKLQKMGQEAAASEAAK